jgi:hypothetical protein
MFSTAVDTFCWRTRWTFPALVVAGTVSAPARLFAFPHKVVQSLASVTSLHLALVCFDAANVCVAEHQPIINCPLSGFHRIKPDPERRGSPKRFLFTPKPCDVLDMVLPVSKVVLAHDFSNCLFFVVVYIDLIRRRAMYHDIKTLFYELSVVAELGEPLAVVACGLC